MAFGKPGRMTKQQRMERLQALYRCPVSDLECVRNLSKALDVLCDICCSICENDDSVLLSNDTYYEENGQK